MRCIGRYSSHMSTIQYRTGDYYGDGTANHIFEIVDADGIASELYITVEHLEVAQVETRKDRRFEGLARELWDAANAQLGEVFHSLPAHRTPEGDAFAEAMGGETVTECHVDSCSCGDLDDDPYGY